MSWIWGIVDFLLGYFSLNEKSGSLILVKQLDREVLSEFTLEIRAYSLSHGTKSITEKQGIG